MKARWLLAAMLLSASASAIALDTGEILRKAKAYAVPSTAPAIPVGPASFAAPAAPGDPFMTSPALFDVVPRSDHREPPPRGACERNANNLCYDVDSKRIVYRPIRKYMPTVDGLTPENISLKRNAIVLKYSFK